MKTAFVCNTPYQLFNILNICCNDLEDTNKGSDLFIVDRFNSSKRILEKIKGLNIFNKIYFIVENKINRRTKYDKIRTLFVSKTKFQDFVCSEYDFLGIKYDQIFIGDAMPFGIALSIFNSDARIFVFEDGIGNYYGDFLHKKPNGLKEKIKSILNYGIYAIYVKSHYVNCKELCDSTVSENIVQLPYWNDNNPAFAIVKNVFEFKDNSRLKLNRVIFLDRPFWENEKYNNLNPEILLNDCGLQNVSLIRIHPRSNTKYKLIDVDNGYNMWELECVYNITDNHILIGDFSMAQLNPKIIANKEPFVVFAYKLFYDRLTNDEILHFEKQINLLKKVYSNKEKIYIPNSKEEFEYTLKKLLR